MLPDDHRYAATVVPLDGHTPYGPLARACGYTLTHTGLLTSPDLALCDRLEFHAVLSAFGTY